jgi:hypothetical protein
MNTQQLTTSTSTTHSAVFETVPEVWVDSRDVPFFRITNALFPPEFLSGAGVLLASYDED